MTETQYFKAIKREIGTDLLDVRIDDEHGDPLKLVQRAKELKKDAERRARLDANERIDEVWCVFDVDEHLRIQEARQMAGANKIELAISNPCFELWALLHFEDLTAHQERHIVRALLKRHLPEYEKELPIQDLHRASAYFGDGSAYFHARDRARDLEDMQARAGDPGANPSTGVHHLTESIRMTVQKGYFEPIGP